MSFDLFACYLDTLGPIIMKSECQDTIKRLAFPSKPATVISRIAEKLRPQKDIINKTCPNFHDIEVAREFLIVRGAGYDFVISDYCKGMQRVLNWMQTNPDSPTELIRQYQVVINVLDHYRPRRRWRYVEPQNDDYFLRNVHKAPGLSIVDSWTNVKRLMKRRT